MKKTKVVVLNKNNARIIVNPDLSEVEGIAPHFWKFDGHKVIAMNQKEMIKRYDDTLKDGASPEVNELYKETSHINDIHWGMVCAVFTAGFAIGLLGGWLL